MVSLRGDPQGRRTWTLAPRHGCDRICTHQQPGDQGAHALRARSTLASVAGAAPADGARRSLTVMSERLLTVVVRRRVPAGGESAFEEAMREFIVFALASAGNRGINALRPQVGSDRVYTVVDRFADVEARRAFTASPQYADWMRRLADLSEGFALPTRRSGRWATATARELSPTLPATTTRSSPTTCSWTPAASTPTGYRHTRSTPTRRWAGSAFQRKR